MGATNIEWTNATWNPVVGCEKVSPGCAHCYAETMAARLKAMALADIAAGKDPGRKRHYIDAIDGKGRWTGKLIPVPEALDEPLRWKKPRMVFVNSMSDLFHKDVPNEFIANVFATMYECQWHTFQVLTKRPEWLGLLASDLPWVIANLVWDRLRVRSPSKAEYVTVGDIERDVLGMWPLPNVWIGVSCEDQHRADERLPSLLKTPAAVRFLSCEPLIGNIDLRTGVYAMLPSGEWRGTSLQGIHWVIVGGESGPKARPCNIQWIRSIVDQCQAASVPCFVKQLGSAPGFKLESEIGYGNAAPSFHHSEAGLYIKAMDDRKGGDPAEWPEDLQVRQFPEV